MTKRQITGTAPDGRTFESTGLGAKRVVGAIRITAMPEAPHREACWLVTIHKDLNAAITGPNQTPMWNNFERWAIAIDENDQPVGEWFGASK